MILPQFCWRQILVFSTHQIVIGKELEICLGNLQASLLYVSAGEEVGIRQHVVVYQLAHNLVREWATVAADDVETINLRTLSVVIWILWSCNAMSHTETDVDARIWTSANDDSLLVFWRELDVGR